MHNHFRRFHFIFEHSLAHIQSRYTDPLYNSKPTNHFCHCTCLLFFFFFFFNPFDHLLQTNLLIIYNSTIASHFSFQRIILPCQPVSYHHYSSSSSLLSAIRFIITARSDKNPPVVACSRLRVNPGRADISGSLKVVLDRLCAVRLLVGRARVPLPLIPTNHPRSSQALSRDSEKSGIKSSRCFCAL